MRDPYLTSPVLNIVQEIDRIRKAHTHIGGLECNLQGPIDESLGATPSEGPHEPKNFQVWSQSRRCTNAWGLPPHIYGERVKVLSKKRTVAKRSSFIPKC